MLPYPQHDPAKFGESAVGVSIASLVAREFGMPVLGVGPRWPTVIGTGVPQAAVDEDRYTMPGKEDVGAAPRAFKRQGCVDPVAQPEPMQVSAQR